MNEDPKSMLFVRFTFCLFLVIVSFIFFSLFQMIGVCGWWLLIIFGWFSFGVDTTFDSSSANRTEVSSSFFLPKRLKSSHIKRETAFYLIFAWSSEMKRFSESSPRSFSSEKCSISPNDDPCRFFLTFSFCRSCLTVGRSIPRQELTKYM